MVGQNDELKGLPTNKRARRGRKRFCRKLKNHMKEWITEKRSKDVNRIVNTIDIRFEAIRFAKQNGWINEDVIKVWCEKVWAKTKFTFH